MDAVKSWLGLKAKDDNLYIPISKTVHQATETSSDQRDLPASKVCTNEISEKDVKTLTSYQNQGEDKPVVKDILPPFSENPKTESNKSCLGCKVIGTATVSTAAAYVLYNGRKNENSFQGFKRLAYRGQYVCLSTSLACLAIAVAFDLGPFQKVKEGEKKTFIGLLQSDIQNFKDLVSKFSS